MRVAIVHDTSLVFGGAERVLQSLLDMYPHADVYVGFISDVYQSYLQKHTDGIIVSSPYNNAPWATIYPDMYKPFVLLWWERLDLSHYDLVIALSHSYSSKSVRPPAGIPYLAYIFTPPRFLWGFYNETQWVHWPLIHQLLSPLFSWMRKKDVQGAVRPDVLIATSGVVKQRIQKIYHRNSAVIYPPVHIPNKQKLGTPKYFLCVSRLVKQKGIDIAIKACNLTKSPLVIVGAGKEEHNLRRIAGATIRFYGFVTDERMEQIYKNAKALLFFSRQEDFGLTPLEAMAHGVPVIASADGGASETVIHGKTGFLLSSLRLSKVIESFREFEKQSFLPYDCRKQAERFSDVIFQNKMRTVIASVTRKSHS